MEDRLEARVGVPVVAELHADVGKDVAPGPGADEGVGVEAELRHPCDACGKSDKGADDGQQAADENGDSAKALEEVFDAVEIVAAEQDVPAEAFDGRATSPGAEPVGRNRAEVAADSTSGGDPEELQLAGVHEIARRRA